MSIKSDRWITRMCTPPEGEFNMGSARIWLNRKDDGWIIRENGVPVDEQFVRPYSEEALADYDFKPLIEPFVAEQVKRRERKDMVWKPLLEEPINAVTVDPYEKVVSYGLSSYGYDVRCGNEFKIFTNINSTVVDPKNFDPKNYVDFEGDCCIIPPNSFALARTIEYFCIPRNVLTVCLGKSTYARCGIIVNVTPFEPEWEGYATLEFSNTTSLPAKIYANEGVAQVVFFQADETCAVSYKDRDGKYMNQTNEPIAPKC